AASVTVECASAYTEAGATALDACAGNLSAGIAIYQSVNTSVVGQYPVTYAVADSQGNGTQVSRTVNVTDTKAPVLTLEGQREIELYVGGPGFVEHGYQAVDQCTGNLTAAVVVDNTINMNTPGVYKVNYRVTDASGNTATDSRTARVMGVKIILQGDATVRVDCVNNFTDPGVKAQRYIDGKLVTVTALIQTATETTENGALIRYWLPGFESEAVTRTIVATGTYGLTLNDVDDVKPLPSGHPYAPGDYLVTWWDCKAPYDDPGAFAWDDCLPGAPEVTVTGAELVDSSEAGQQFEVVYSVRLRGTEYHRVRLVQIEDNSPPVLSLKGAGLSVTTPGGTPSWLSAAVARYVQVYGSTEGLPEAWPVLEEWNPRTTPLIVNCDRPHYEDPGALAYDLCSGEIAAEDILFVMTYWNNVTEQEEFRFIGDMSAFNFPDNPANPLPRLFDDNPSDPNVQGHYRTYYYTRDDSGLETMASRAIEVEFFVTIAGLQPYREIPCSNTPYDPLAGVMVMDLCEGDLTSTLIVTGKVNPQVPGQYKLRYDHRGSYGLWELPYKEVVVEVVDRQAPVIVLLDELGRQAASPAVVYLPWCANQTDPTWWSRWFAVLPNKGFVVEDACDDNARLTNEVRVSGVKELSTALDILSNPNLSQAEREAYLGTYTIRYNVIDASGNAATPAYRTVVVGSMPAFKLGSFADDQMSEDGFALVKCLEAPYAEPADFAVASPCPNDPVTVLPYVPGA
ncbi:MAG TPA: DUF5011 domain-containing protein, partial [Candidatus Hydrogenedentes bacterium]|nr:DUF5011 domain-containing protein [Candidatus Hydrogenedentota bacterium]